MIRKFDGRYSLNVWPKYVWLMDKLPHKIENIITYQTLTRFLFFKIKQLIHKKQKKEKMMPVKLKHS